MQYVSPLFSLVVFALFLISCGFRTKQEMELPLPCFDSSGHFLSKGTVLPGPIAVAVHLFCTVKSVQASMWDSALEGDLNVGVITTLAIF